MEGNYQIDLDFVMVIYQALDIFKSGFTDNTLV